MRAERMMVTLTALNSYFAAGITVMLASMPK
jgi:hypothetical protein